MKQHRMLLEMLPKWYNFDVDGKAKFLDEVRPAPRFFEGWAAIMMPIKIDP